MREHVDEKEIMVGDTIYIFDFDENGLAVKTVGMVVGMTGETEPFWSKLVQYEVDYDGSSEVRYLDPTSKCEVSPSGFDPESWTARVVLSVDDEDEARNILMKEIDCRIANLEDRVASYERWKAAADHGRRVLYMYTFVDGKNPEFPHVKRLPIYRTFPNCYLGVGHMTIDKGHVDSVGRVFELPSNSYVRVILSEMNQEKARKLARSGVLEYLEKKQEEAQGLEDWALGLELPEREA